MGTRQLDTYDSVLIDVPFPVVPPTAGSSAVQTLAIEVLQTVGVFGPDGTPDRKKCWDNPIFHVMGEMTLTYILVRYLLQMGFTVVASTTERLSVENPDGTKTAQFKFVQFRKY